MEFVFDNGSVIKSEQNTSSTELVISKSTQIPVPNFPITVSQVSTELDSPNEEFIPLSSNGLENYGTARKKRQPKSVPDPKSWNKNESKRRRLMGEMYTGYRRVNKEKTRMVQDTPKQERKLGPACKSKLCSKQKTKNCDQISEQQRAALFDCFWKEMTWPEKKMFVCAMIDVKEPQQKTTKGKQSRRGNTYRYNLKVGDNRVPVCKSMFTNSLDLKWSTIKRWIASYSSLGTVSDEEEALLFSEETSSNLEEHTPLVQKNQQQHVTLQTELSPINLRRETMKVFLDEIPKLPSHYCRQSSSKLYVQSDIKSHAQLYQLYIEYSNNASVLPLSRFSFDRMCRAEKIAIFSPRKDQCDLCCQYKAGNLSDNSFNAHRKRKDEARAQKEADKKSAVEKKCYTLCCDLMAVKMVPQLQASSLYYKMKLAVHNFTVYNLETHDVICYWFDESQTDLVASSFASCLIDAVEELLDKSGPRPIVNIFSDGCTYQNRNSILSNALLDLSIRKNVIINQKYLEKGHTQMEADSVHSVLEGAMRNRDIYLPSQLIDITKNARKNPFPYRVKFVNWQFFRDFSKSNLMIYDTIRPGKKSGDPVVTDLRWLQYNSSGQIKFALDFFTELQPLPIRPKTNIRTGTIIFPPLNSGPVKIPKDKWKDLQDIKPVLPHDCHNYYDLLPHADISYRQSKKAEKEKANKATKLGQ